VGRVWPRLGHRGRPLNSVVIRHMVRAVRSYLASLRASRLFGQATRLRDDGRKLEAMAAARRALAILAQPHIIRTHPAEGSLLASTTILVEGLAAELNQPGASADDLADSLAFLRAFGNKSYLAAWVPYLERRSNQGGASAV
jgi:hypothetical protein